ncbi:MAG: armadillo-type fold-containing protein [Cyanobacteria bacterium P01_C01_bin.38]
MANLASSYWQRFIKNIPLRELPQLKTRAMRRISQRKNPAQLLWFLTIVVAMLLWNPKLLFASGSGIFVMLLVYSMPQWDWSIYLHQLRNYLQTTSGRLVLSVTSGAIACLGTYTAVTIWADAPNVWIGGGAIVQGMATVLVLILLARLLISLHEDREDKLERSLNNLTDTDPLKRLISVRQLTKLATQLEPDEKKYIIECLQLLLTNESEAKIRDAAFDSLQALEPAEKLIPKSNPTTLVPFSVKAKNRVSC